MKHASCIFLLVLVGSALFAQRSEKQRERWNKNLTQDTSYRFSKEPNALVVETIKERPPGKALDVGMGQGRNSIYLASQGWEVIGIDITDEAIELAQAEARSKNLKINTLISSMDDFDFGTDQWDLIVFVYERCIEKPMVEKLKKSLKKNGLVVYEFFHREAGLEEGRSNFGCETNAIKNNFEKSGGFKILKYSEPVEVADFGLKKRKLVKLVAEKY